MYPFIYYRLYWVSTAYIPFLGLTTVKYNKLCGLNNRNVYFQSSAGSKLEIKVSTGLVPSDIHKKESVLCLPNSFWWFTCNLLCSDVSLCVCVCVDVSLTLSSSFYSTPCFHSTGSPVSGFGFQSAVWLHLRQKFLHQHYFLINSNSQARAFNTGMQEIENSTLRETLWTILLKMLSHMFWRIDVFMF